MSQPQPTGYLANPASGAGAGLLVLHPWWGLNDTVKAFCDRLAGQDFVAFAPDLYHGVVATTIKDAQALSDSLTREQVKADLANAVAFLGGRPEVTAPGLGVIGFSLGANLALGLSVNYPDSVRAVVVFYGTRPADYQLSRAAYLGHFAETDDFEPASAVAELEKALVTAGRPVTFYTYQGTGHWFFEPDRTDAYNPEAAQLAWERTLPFLRNAFSS